MVVVDEAGRHVVVRIFGYGGKPSETNKPGMCNIAHALSK